MKYTYQNDDMDALRVTFEEMIDEIADLRNQLFEGDEALITLYNEANDLERELHLLREQYDQDMFDAEEDLIELEQAYNLLVRDYNELIDDTIDEDFDESEDQWELFHVTGVTFN